MLGVSDLVSEECHAAILIADIDLSWLMTYAEHVEAEKLRKKRCGESKRTPYDGGFQSSKGGCFQQGHKFQGKGSSNSQNKRFANDRVPNPNV
ncbi:hypothetical protein L3H44_11090, partial [Corynebacterium sp. MC-12]